VRPGITDLASIEYRDENALLGASTDPERTYIEQVMPAKLRLCERYVRERSFLGDLAIIGRTFKASFVPRD
jgi:lipopolysaccharide/colanic/teichoic acid biosynthesis glycosyltransferase